MRTDRLMADEVWTRPSSESQAPEKGILRGAPVGLTALATDRPTTACSRVMA